MTPGLGLVVGRGWRSEIVRRRRDKQRNQKRRTCRCSVAVRGGRVLQPKFPSWLSGTRILTSRMAPLVVFGLFVADGGPPDVGMEPAPLPGGNRMAAWDRARRHRWAGLFQGYVSCVFCCVCLVGRGGSCGSTVPVAGGRCDSAWDSPAVVASSRCGQLHGRTRAALRVGVGQSEV